MLKSTVLVLLALVCACGNRSAQSEQERREEEFRKTMTGATLAGRFSSNQSDKIAADKYTISSVTKVGGDVWTINTRIQYGEHDVTVPVPLRVWWAGDTPVLSLTDAGLPGLGTFTARVLIHNGQYAGTWASDKGHGGQLFGRLERASR